MRILSRQVAAVVVLIVVAVTIVSGQSVQGSSTDAKLIEGEVRKLNAEEVQGFTHNDPKTLARLWATILL